MIRRHRYLTKFTLSQRGLSLVEVMIILVVVGLLLSASIIPFGSLWGDGAYTREREKMAVLQEAIVGYAASHSTKERIVIVEESGRNSRQFTLPAGRPYLPCPDIDGDGYEDRVGYDTTGEAAQTPAATLIIDFPMSDNDLLEEGNCYVSRGTLPWKTLGTPPADYWGSRYTYQVDDIFSNALIGFNQDTVIDVFDYRRPVTVNSGDIYYRRRDSSGINPLANYDNSRRPIVVCDGRVDLCQGSGTGGTSPLMLEAGRLVITGFDTPRRTYLDEDVIEGLPYVIVSHGDNRLGAVNHEANLRDTVDPGLVCNWPIDDGGRDYAVPDHLLHEAVNFPLVEADPIPSSLRECSPVTYGGNSLHNGFFVSQPRVRRFILPSYSGDSFDDIVVWQTRQELTQYFIDAGILPAENFPVLRPY